MLLPRTAPVGTALLVALTLGLGGCASKDDSPSKPAAGQSPETSTPTVTPSTPESTPTEPTPTPSPATLTDRLLPTDAVPGLNASWHWEDGETGPADASEFGLCAKVDLVSIGATEVVQRTYFPPVDTDDNAAEQVAEFPDATTTATALKVLKSWRKNCAAKNRKVGPLVSVDGGSWYLVTVTPPNADEGMFQAVGLVTSGNRIAVLTMDSIGQDFNYPAGQEPMVAMVKAGAGLLG
jgi:hypothetical protein